MEITAKKTVNDEAREATIICDFGDDLKSATELFGAEVIFSCFIANVKITAQAAVRRMLETGSDQAAIEARMNEWKPGQKLERISDPVGSFKKKLAVMDPEARAALLAELMDM